MSAEPIGEVSDPALLRQVYGAFATGVTVVTVGGDTPHAMTANSFSTVSLDPPLILVCVGRDALMHDVLAGSGRFAVSVLAAHQEPVARYYADRSRPLGRQQFDFTDWLPGRCTDAFLLAGATAHFECELWRSYDGGDHTVFVGRLLATRRFSEDALLFLCGKFRRPALEPSAAVAS
ncbi:flavin reductase family protein [Dactylosporangium sp. NPDC051484]|uniref:flavin reductase family protein n=1 Tax=Dactylosporangium sp. NPDC051484 TaxID=3154942 RepID=UPI00345057A0